MQYVVQLGHHAWLSFHHGQICLTHSGAHAERYSDQDHAGRMAEYLRDNRAHVAGNSAAMTPASRALYADPAASPVTVLLASELDARLHANRGDREGHRPANAKAPAEPNPERAPGVTRQIYNWTLDNPQATKADALAAFPSANPSTVGVQFSAARRAASNV